MSNRERANRDAYLKRMYNLSLLEWEEIFKRQGNQCATCDRTEPGVGHRWHTDHDHETGLVRGILCRDCNLMLSKWTTVERLQKLVDYLTNPPASYLYGTRLRSRAQVEESKLSLKDMLNDQVWQ